MTEKTVHHCFIRHQVAGMSMPRIRILASSDLEWMTTRGGIYIGTELHIGRTMSFARTKNGIYTAEVLYDEKSNVRNARTGRLPFSIIQVIIRDITPEQLAALGRGEIVTWYSEAAKPVERATTPSAGL